MKHQLLFLIFFLFSCSHQVIKEQANDLGISPDKGVAFFETYDLAVLPNEDILLTVKLYNNESIFPYANSITNEVVELYHKEKLIEKSMISNETEQVIFKLKAPASKGLYLYQINLSNQSAYFASAEIVISVLEKCSPIMIVDIDKTIADVSGIPFLFSDYKSILPLKNSSQLLETLAKKLNIIYLTARNEVFMQHTRKWLDYYNFVKAPVFFWSYSKHPFDTEEYKTYILKALGEKFKNIVIGVGDRETDVAAYVANGLKAYYITDNQQKIKNSISVSSWDKIIEDLNNNPPSDRELCK